MYDFIKKCFFCGEPIDFDYEKDLTIVWFDQKWQTHCTNPYNVCDQGKKHEPSS